jgi:hypothetical protein
MNEERTAIQMMVAVIAWFAIVLVAFFFIGALIGLAVIVLGALAFGWWLARIMRSPDQAP